MKKWEKRDSLLFPFYFYPFLASYVDFSRKILYNENCLKRRFYYDFRNITRFMEMD